MAEVQWKGICRNKENEVQACGKVPSTWMRALRGRRFLRGISESWDRAQSKGGSRRRVMETLEKDFRKGAGRGQESARRIFLSKSKSRVLSLLPRPRWQKIQFTSTPLYLILPTLSPCLASLPRIVGWELGQVTFLLTPVTLLSLLKAELKLKSKQSVQLKLKPRTITSSLGNKASNALHGSSVQTSSGKTSRQHQCQSLLTRRVRVAHAQRRT